MALDTTNILGRGAVKDTYNLLADGIVKLARVLARQAGRELAAWAEQHGYGRDVTTSSLKGAAEIDWSDPEQRRRFLGEVVADADRLLDQARRARAGLDDGSAEDAALVEAAGVVSRVLQQDLEWRADGPALKQGVADDRLVSVHDPEMRHGRKSTTKRFDGHKAAVVVDTDTQLITAVTVVPGNAQAHEQALELVEQTEATTDCEVEVSIGDGASGDGQTRQAFADATRELVAKIGTATNQGRFPKTAFRIDLDVLSCTCPGGQTTSDLKKGGPGPGRFHFAAAVCGPGPLRAQCVKGAGARTVDLHAQEGLLQGARELQASPAFGEYLRQRQVVEHRLARLVQLGIRQARYVGRAKTAFQLLMAAAVATLTLLANAAAAEPAPTVVVGAVSALAGLLLALWGCRECSVAPDSGRGPRASDLADPALRPPSPAAVAFTIAGFRLRF